MRERIENWLFRKVLVYFFTSKDFDQFNHLKVKLPYGYGYVAMTLEPLPPESESLYSEI